MARCRARPPRPAGSPEAVALEVALGRVLSGDIRAEIDVPQFARAMMDGFAVRAADTAGATNYNRLALVEIGQSLPGTPFKGCIGRGQAVRIMTGAPLPEGADAVLPVEQCEPESERLADGSPLRRVLAVADVSPGKHVGQVGEDIQVGSTILAAGRVLRPQDLGVLSSLGIGCVEVVARPKVRLVVTGNELVPAGQRPTACQITDANGPMLTALAQRDGGEVVQGGIIPDQRDAIEAAMHADVQVVLVSGGSSCGQEDHAPTLLAEHGDLAIHGIAMRPSSPTGMGTLGPRMVFLLPGNPVSCLCAYDFFAGRAIRALAGRSRKWPYLPIELPLKTKLVSQIGRLDYARVRIENRTVVPLATGAASVLSNTTRADGFVVVPSDSEGFPPAHRVMVWRYDPVGAGDQAHFPVTCRDPLSPSSKTL